VIERPVGAEIGGGGDYAPTMATMMMTISNAFTALLSFSVKRLG
jgi:hypothetical protein